MITRIDTSGLPLRALPTRSNFPGARIQLDHIAQERRTHPGGVHCRRRSDVERRTARHESGLAKYLAKRGRRASHLLRVSDIDEALARLKEHGRS